MNENKKYYWLKLKEDFFRNKKIKKLRTIAGGDTYTIIYLKMQLLSLKNDGTLVFEGVEDSFAEEIALDIDEDPENVKVTLMFLIKNGLLEEAEQDRYVMTEAIKCIGSESASKERVAAYRKRKKIRESIPLELVTKLSNEQILLPDGNAKFIDNKRYGGNAEYVYELAMCKCENCGESDTKTLVIHHNNEYSNDLEDLYLLCRKCHANVENGNITELKHNRKSVTCNTLVTTCNTEIEIEKEKEIEIEEKEKEKEKNVTGHLSTKCPDNSTLKQSFEPLDPKCIQNGSKMDPQKRLDYMSTAETADEPECDVFIKIILNDKTYYPISNDLLNQYKELYPAVDVEQELRKFAAWSLSNPTKRKTKRGILRSINSWLSSEQDKGHKKTTQMKEPDWFYKQNKKTDVSKEEEEEMSDFLDNF